MLLQRLFLIILFGIKIMVLLLLNSLEFFKLYPIIKEVKQINTPTKFSPTKKAIIDFEPKKTPMKIMLPMLFFLTKNIIKK